MLLGVLNELLVHVVDDAVPLACLNAGGDEVVLADGLLELLEEHPVDLHPSFADGLFLDCGEDVPSGVSVGGGISDAFAAPFSSKPLGFRELQDLVVVELFLEVLAVGKEVEEFEGGLPGFLEVCLRFLVEELLAEVVLAGASALDLDEVGRREDRPEEAEVQDIGAVVSRGHHADGDADAGLAGPVGGGSWRSRGGCCW